MAIISRRPRPRLLHIEPGFHDADFVAEYGAETKKFPVEFQGTLQYLASQFDSTQPAEVLEIGPGPGWMAILLAKSHPAVRITGIDVSHAFVELANSNARNEGVADRVKFCVGDAATMSEFCDQSFDVVMSHQSLHYWNPPEQVLDQIARVLKSTGIFCISDDRRDMNWRGKLQVLLGRCSLSRRIGSSWLRSVRGCLTSEEAAAALAKSQLRDRGQISVRSRTLFIQSFPRRVPQ